MGSQKVKSLLRIASGVVIAVLLLAIGLLLAVRVTPIPLKPVALIFQATLSTLLDGAVQVDGAKLVWSENNRRLMLVVDRIDIVDRDGAKIDARDISLGVSAEAFWNEQKFAISHIDVREMALSPSKYASLPISTRALLGGDEADASEGAVSLRARFNRFELFAIRSIRFAGDDSAASAEKPSSLLLMRENNTLKGSANIAYRRDGKDTKLTALASLTPGTDGEMDIDFQNINPRDIGLFSRFLAPLQALQLPISGNLHVEFDGAAEPTQAEFNLHVEPGALLLSEAIMPIDELTLGLDADFAEQRVWVRDGRFNIAGVGGSLGGHMDFVLRGDLIGSLALSLEGNGIVIDRPGLFQNKLAVSLAQAEISYDVAEALLEIDRLTLNHTYGRAETTGQIFFANNRPVFDFVVNFGDMSREAVTQLWPTPVAIKTRNWVDANVMGGKLESGTLALRATLDELVSRERGTPLREEALQLDLNFDKVDIRFLAHLPPLQQTKAGLSLRGTSFRAKVMGGEIQLAVADSEMDSGTVTRPVTVEEAEIVLPDYRAIGAPAEISFTGDAIIADMMRALALPPLNVGKTVNFDFDRVTGRAQATAKLKLPLIVPVGSPRPVQYDVDARSDDFAVKEALGPFVLDKGRAFININNAGLDMQGRAAANGVDVGFAWQQPFVAEKADEARLAVAGHLSPQDIADLGQGWAGVRLKGAPMVNLLISGPVVQPHSYRAHVDLTEAQFFPRPLAYEKPKGTPSHIEAAIKNRDGQVEQIRARLHVDGDELVATQLNFEDGVLKKASMTPINLGKSKNIQVSVAPQEESSFVSLSADVFDAEKLFSTANKEVLVPDTPFAFLPFLGPDVVVEGRINEVVGAHGTSLEGAKLRLVRKDGVHEQAWLDGVFGDGTDLLGSIERNDATKRDFSLQTENAGNLFRMFDWVEEFYGGALTVQGKMYDTGFDTKGRRKDLDGRLTMVSFRARNVGVLAQILTLASLTGIADTLGGDGIKFEKAKSNFSITDGVINIGQGQVNGPAVGLTGQGDFDMVTGDVDIGGTLVPAYSINSFLGKIPLIGRIFSSREGEGLIGIGYRVAGERGDVGVLVNPLSVLTPGVFRRIFEIGIGLPDRDPDPAPDVTAEPEDGTDSVIE